MDEFSEEYGISKVISAEAMTELTHSYWHGNIRELRNMIERLVVSYDGEYITARQVKNLLFSAQKGRTRAVAGENVTLSQLMDEYEREILMTYLEQYQTAAEVARQLHVDKSTIGRKLKKYDIISK